MSFATDEIVRKALTDTTVLNKLIPQLWAAQIERNLRIQACLQQSIVENTDLLVPGAGDTVYIPTLPDLTGTLDLLTESTDIVDGVLDTATSVAFTPKEYGKGIGVTRKSLDRIKYDGVEAIIDRLSYVASRTIEGQIAALYNASVPGTATKMGRLYVATDDTGATVHTSADVVATDVFNSEIILRGWQTLMQNNNVPFEDGFFRLYISPKQYKDLMLNDKIRDDIHFGSPEKMFRGEVGALHNCRIIVTNSLVNDSEGAGAAVPVTNALLLAPRWAAVAWKRRIGVTVDPTVYDYGRRRRFGVFGDWDLELLHADRAVCLVSAA